MKHLFVPIMALVLCLQALPALAEKAQVSEKNKEQLRTLLATLKAKAATDKPAEQRVALPTASAGARGAQVRSMDRFAILWPGETISPLTALAMTITHEANEGTEWAQLRKQLATFSDSFPEHRNNALLKNLDALLKSTQ